MYVDYYFGAGRADQPCTQARDRVVLISDEGVFAPGGLAISMDKSILAQAVDILGLHSGNYSTQR
jgi:hypothetical protein